VSILVAVTDHAAERFRQRVGGRSGELDVRPEIITRVARAWDAGRTSDAGRGTIHIRDLVDRSVVFVCRREGAEVIVITLWEQEGGPAAPRVPQRYTNALKRDDDAPLRNK
jgi:hypothetical protein